MSPLRSSAGPAVCTKGTSSSEAMICASDVLPRPGGPASSTWSSASPRAAAASIETCSCSRRPSWPTNSSRRARAQRAVELVLAVQGARGVDALEASTLDPPQRAGQQLLGRLALGRGEQRLRLGGLEAELEQAVAGEVARVVAARDGDRLVEARWARRPSRAARRRSARPCACRCRARPAGGRRRRRPARRRARAGVPPLSTASATFGPTDCTPMSARKRSRSSSVAKP